MGLVGSVGKLSAHPHMKHFMHAVKHSDTAFVGGQLKSAVRPKPTPIHQAKKIVAQNRAATGKAAPKARVERKRQMVKANKIASKKPSRRLHVKNAAVILTKHAVEQDPTQLV